MDIGLLLIKYIYIISANIVCCCFYVVIYLGINLYAFRIHVGGERIMNVEQCPVCRPVKSRSE